MGGAEGGTVSEVWYYADQRDPKGPFSLEQLKGTLARLPDAADVLVWHAGLKAWKKAKEVPELVAQTTKPPPLPAEQPAATAAQAYHKALKTYPKVDRTAFRRLWRGELPLGEAFWAYFLTGWIAMGFIAAALSVALWFPLQYVNLGPLAGYIGFGLYLSYLAFAAVGVWRSATWRTAGGVLARLFLLWIFGSVLLWSTLRALAFFL